MLSIRPKVVCCCTVMVSYQHAIKFALIWMEKESSLRVSVTIRGIFRDIKQKVNIEEKISLGRKTVYTLMDAGLHSGRGLRNLYVPTYGLHT